jgi:N,N'-diacetyllegionaminate synthase
VKTQSFFGEDTASDDPEREWFRQVELSDQMHFELKKLALDKGVRFLSAPFNVERARFLVEQLRLTEIKVASGTLRHLPILDYLNSRADVVDTIYMSTGLATLEEIRDSLSHLKDIRRVVIMHCIACYPADDEDANLRAITTLGQEFPGHEIGFSDHTRGIDACVAAVALGATVLEKHFTFNVLMPGDDHAGGMTPQDEAELVRRLTHVEKMLGTGEKVPCAKEKENWILRNRFGE